MSTEWKNRTGGWYGTYRKLRAVFMQHNAENNGGRCQLAIENVCTGTATQVHHVLGIAVNKLDTRYWQATCKECNQHVGDPNAGTQPRARVIDQW